MSEPEPAGPSAESTLILRLAAGAGVIVIAALAFGWLARNVAPGAPLTDLDARVAAFLHLRARSNPGVTDAMVAVSLVNGYTGILALAAVFALFLARAREWGWLALLGLAVPGGMGVNTLAKLAFARQRPSFEEPLVMLSTYSFPSGHTLAATVFYGTLAAFVTTHIGAAHRAWPWLLAMGAVVIVACSRLWLGAHYLSDVIAAFAEGAAWLACCLVALSTYRWRVRRRERGRRRPSGMAA